MCQVWQEVRTMKSDTKSMNGKRVCQLDCLWCGKKDVKEIDFKNHIGHKLHVTVGRQTNANQTEKTQ